MQPTFDAPLKKVLASATNRSNFAPGCCPPLPQVSQPVDGIGLTALRCMLRHASEKSADGTACSAMRTNSAAGYVVVAFHCGALIAPFARATVVWRGASLGRPDGAQSTSTGIALLAYPISIDMTFAALDIAALRCTAQASDPSLVKFELDSV